MYTQPFAPSIMISPFSIIVPSSAKFKGFGHSGSGEWKGLLEFATVPHSILKIKNLHTHLPQAHYTDQECQVVQDYNLSQVNPGYLGVG
jgi:hypothetical protein